MKKYIAILMTVVVAATMFAACSKNKDDSKSTAKNETTQTTETTELATDKAKITGSDAINLLKSYSTKELGLSDVKKDYQFMLGTTGVDIDGDNYIRAVAGAMVENGKDKDGNTTYSMEDYGTYYINYDGTKILIQKGDNKYDTIKIDSKKLDAIKTTATAKAETTTKK